MDPSKLENEILSHQIPLGTTDFGKAWCLRALHPAHPSLAFHGIPDRVSVPTCLLEFRSVFSITPPTAAVNNWGCKLAFMPHPIAFCDYVSYSGTGQYPNTLFNNQIPGTYLGNKVDYWASNISQARIGYYGVTITYDAPTLLDQGTLVSAQIPVSYAVQQDAVGAGSAQPFKGTWQTGTPTYDSVIHLPMAVQYQGRDGAYLTMKLSDPACAFSNQSTVIHYDNLWNGSLEKDLTPYLSTLAGIVIFDNMSLQTSLRITIRIGVESIVPVASVYSLFSSPSCPPDPAAMDAYFALSSRLLDCYPSSYNDWNQLWGAIKNVARVVLPVVGSLAPLIPGIGQGVRWATDAASAALGRSAKNTSRQRNQMTADAIRALSTSEGTRAVQEQSRAALLKSKLPQAESSKPRSRRPRRRKLTIRRPGATVRSQSR